MNPDTAAAIPELVAAGELPAAAAGRLLRVARGELTSVRAELRAVLYVGVLTLTGGVGVLVAAHLEQIGPLTIAVALGVAALAALGWVAHTAPAFAWHDTASPNLAFDYVLLLGILLAAADLAYVEYWFTPLGRHWPWHLLLVAALAGAAAVRFDSRVAFSLALSTFAAWRGVAVGTAGGSAPWAWTPEVRANAVACGALFALLGLGMARARRKPHFAPVAFHLGWLLIFCGIGAGMEGGAVALVRSAAALLAAGTGLAAGAWWRRRFSLFALGVAGAAVGVLVLIGHAFANDERLGCFFICVVCLALVAGLLAANRHLGRAR